MGRLEEMKFTCPTCDHTQRAVRINIMVHLFEKQPMYNHVGFLCACGERWALFGLNEIIDASTLDNWVVAKMKYAPKQIIEAYAKVYFHNTLPPQEEDIVTYFHRILMDVGEISDIEWGKNG